ncbi:MAG: pyridoxamine 5'-phosphate oxidase family protein [Bacteroidales bacterium]|nr:pyridoxamine 5'-phosphate oxidase family protein [Bacteroidales bacterium]
MLQPTNNAIRVFRTHDSIEKIIKKSQICHVAMVDGEKPYIIGMNFGYKDKIIYLHCDKIGKKIDILKKNNNVSVFFTADTDLFARHPEVGCSWRMRYRSVQANGKAEFVDDYDKKLEALNIFMENYSEKPVSFSKPAVDNILIIEVKIDDWTGRSFEY